MDDFFELNPENGDFDLQIINKLNKPDCIDYLYNLFLKITKDYPDRQYMTLLKNYLATIVQDHDFFDNTIEHTFDESNLDKFVAKCTHNPKFFHFYMFSTDIVTGMKCLAYIIDNHDNPINFLTSVNVKWFQKYFETISVENMILPDDITDHYEIKEHIFNSSIIRIFFCEKYSIENSRKMYEYIASLGEVVSNKLFELTTLIFAKFKDMKTVPDDIRTYDSDDKIFYLKSYLLLAQTYHFIVNSLKNPISDDMFNYLFSAKNSDNYGSKINDIESSNVNYKILSSIVYNHALGIYAPDGVLLSIDEGSSISSILFGVNPTVSLMTNLIKQWIFSNEYVVHLNSIMNELVLKASSFSIPVDSNIDDLLWTIMFQTNILITKKIRFTVILSAFLTKIINKELTNNPSARKFALDLLSIAHAKFPKEERLCDLYDEGYQKTFFAPAVINLFCDVESLDLRFKIMTRQKILQIFKYLALTEDKSFIQRIDNVAKSHRITSMKFINYMTRDYISLLDDFNKIGEEITKSEDPIKKQENIRTIEFYLKLLIEFIRYLNIYTSDLYPNMRSLFMEKELVLNYCNVISALLVDFIRRKKGNLAYLSDSNPKDVIIARSFYSLISIILMAVQNYMGNKEFATVFCLTINDNTIITEAIHLVKAYAHPPLTTSEIDKLDVLEAQYSETIKSVTENAIPPEDYPEEFIDTIITFMAIENPVAIPVGDKTYLLDSSSIRLHVLNTNTNPIDRSPLTFESLEEFNSRPDIKKNIDDYKQRFNAWLEEYRKSKN